MAHIKDLSDSAGLLRVASPKLDGDARPAKIGCHGKVGDGGNHCHACGDVVKDACMSKTSSVDKLSKEELLMSRSKSYLGLVNARPMKIPVATIITEQTVQYQSLPRTVM
jgi:hypothetical protein